MFYWYSDLYDVFLVRLANGGIKAFNIYTNEKTKNKP